MHPTMIFKFEIASEPLIKAAITITTVFTIAPITTTTQTTSLGIVSVVTIALVTYAIGHMCAPPFVLLLLSSFLSEHQQILHAAQPSTRPLHTST